ncbi:hypothetical protein JMJ35_000204 [Cladonia borealis]|uniref:Pentatricopeptide repeat protein n=1 Tax=Cladonia borealis TaxID=184061 RepID=A0AA39V7T4_9LECA|nr:hypothetical protein JMJ35_000204 [Cladonia borealis]
MFLKSQGHLRSLAVKALLAAGQPRILLVTLNASTTRAFLYRLLEQSTVSQWIHRQYLHSSVVLDEGDVQQADSTSIIQCAETPNSQSPPTFRVNQIENITKIVLSEEQRNRKPYTDQIATLPRLNSGGSPKDENEKALVFGKHQADKQLINQRLKDKGRLSYDWRIPLRQLEQAAASSMGNQYLKSYISAEYRIRRMAQGPSQYSAQLAREVPRPAVWSEATLYYYVVKIADTQKTQRHVPGFRKRKHLDMSSNKADITRIFEDLFYDDSVKTFMSSEACNAALRFFYVHGMISKARALFSRMESLQLDIPSATFNVMLRGAALNRDLHNFTYLLQRMIQRGFRPDDDTWVSLLIAVDSKEIRAIVAHKMRERNVILSPGSTKAVAELMIPNEVDLHLGGGHDHSTFVDHMDIRYGTQWLNTRIVNKILYEMGKRGCTNGLGLLKQIKQRSFVPDDVTMNTLLRLCPQPSLYHDAIEVLKFFDCQFRMGPGDQVYETLLNMAWNGGLLNWARVVWRSACIDGHVNFHTRLRVFQSLLDHNLRELSSSDKVGSRDNQGRGQIFRRLAGYFVVGVRRPQTAELAKLGEALWVSDFDSKNSSVIRARLQVQSDLRNAKLCRLKVPLHELLRQALELDLKWRAEGFWKNEDRQRKLQDGIQVEVEHISDRPIVVLSLTLGRVRA